MVLPKSLQPAAVDGVQFAADKAYQQLRDAILDGDIAPNRRLVEEDLAAQLEVSRTPVREALLRLAQEGLVARVRGWVVRDHSPEEALRIVEARAAVESAAARLAADHITAADLDQLAGIADAIDRPGATVKDLNRLNRQFHGLITAACGNPLLIQFAQRTNISHWSLSATWLMSAKDAAEVNAEHRQMIDALRARDGAAVEALVRAHIGRTQSILIQAV
ncbi:GntR family transcriptional regulator [Actinoplanes sp. NBC_00393]|uniref:GntR family transcriptional regulator n=1 Tax=Actinoplanes sp. NBC_00393 TaxID=2975953 RepID=UPI002E23B930